VSSSLKPTASPVDPRLIRIVPTRSSVTPIMVRMGDMHPPETIVRVQVLRMSAD